MWLSALALGTGCGADQAQEVEDVPPGITFEQLSFRSYRGTRLTASGEADRATLRRDTSDVSAERLRLRLPAAAGGEHLVEAPRGHGNLRAGEGHLRGGVVVTLQAGSR